VMVLYLVLVLLLQELLYGFRQGLIELVQDRNPVRVNGSSTRERRGRKVFPEGEDFPYCIGLGWS